jgi:hypothetical protein
MQVSSNCVFVISHTSVASQLQYRSYGALVVYTCFRTYHTAGMGLLRRAVQYFLPVHHEASAVSMFQIGNVDLRYPYFVPCTNNFQLFLSKCET